MRIGYFTFGDNVVNFKSYFASIVGKSLGQKRSVPHNGGKAEVCDSTPGYHTYASSLIYPQMFEVGGSVLTTHSLLSTGTCDVSTAPLGQTHLATNVFDFHRAVGWCALEANSLSALSSFAIHLDATSSLGDVHAPSRLSRGSAATNETRSSRGPVLSWS